MVGSLARTLLALGAIAGTLMVRSQQHAFIQYSTRDGLCQSQVRCMAQDQAGYLWFGTVGGASRFDGQMFVNYTIEDGLPDVQVNDLFSDRHGRLWFATNRGLAVASGRTVRTYQLPNALQNERILAISEDRRSLLISVDGHGVYRVASSGARPLEGFPLDTADQVRAIRALPDGSVLIGMRNGLLKCADGSCRSISVGNERPKSISAVAVDRQGVIWVGTFGDGVYRIDPSGTQENIDESKGLLQNNIRHLLVDDRDRVWVSTKFGVNQIELDGLRSFTIYRGMPNDNVMCTYQAHDGSIWFGTDGAGTLKYAGDRFVTFTTADGLCSDQVMCIVPDQRGDLWLGTYGNGICRLDGMAMINTLDGLPNNTVWCGIGDRQGRLWFGTSEGLCTVENGVAKPFMNATIGRVRVLSLLEDPEGRIWCGTREGVVVIDGDRTLDMRIQARSVRALLQGRDGTVWMGTDRGLIGYANGAFTMYSIEDGLPDNTVFCLAQDQRDRLWIGTSNGLACLEGKKIQVMRLGRDHSSNYVNLLQIDQAGDLAVGTNNGLHMADPDSLLLHGSFEHFTETDGLRSREFNLNATLLDDRGRSWFGTAAGLLLQSPSNKDIETGRAPPRAHITELRSFLQRTDWSSKSDSIDTQSNMPIGLRIPYQRNYLTFDYAGVELDRPDKVQYSYRLDGYDQVWLPPTDARFASYSNLSQGDYTFLVRARSPGSDWSRPAAFAFSILPPFWSTWWFFLLCLSAVALIIHAVLRWRSRIRHRHERTRQLLLRSRMLQLEQQALNANMNRHFVFNALNSIQYYINRQDKTSANRYLTSFAKLIRKNLDNSQNDMTDLAEELDRLALYLDLEHMRFKDRFTYELVVEPGIDLASVQIPAMMLQPYVENSIWHGILPTERPGHVSMHVKRLGLDRIIVRIEDDGVGIEHSLRMKSGNTDHISKGIEITKGRTDVLRKLAVTDIRIQGPTQLPPNGNGRAQGTVVEIEIPLNRPALPLNEP